MSASMAEVVRAHRINYVGSRCFCNDWKASRLTLTTLSFLHEHADHVAEQLAANGYGKLPEPVTEWGAAFRVTGARYNSYRTKDEAEEFVKSMNEVDADMVVITRQHTPATNTEWRPE